MKVTAINITNIDLNDRAAYLIDDCLSVVYFLEYVGIKARFILPSERNILNKFDIRNTIKNMSEEALAPNIAEIRTSLINVDTLVVSNIVIKVNVLGFFGDGVFPDKSDFSIIFFLDSSKLLSAANLSDEESILFSVLCCNQVVFFLLERLLDNKE